MEKKSLSYVHRQSQCVCFVNESVKERICLMHVLLDAGVDNVQKRLLHNVSKQIVAQSVILRRRLYRQVHAIHWERHALIVDIICVGRRRAVGAHQNSHGSSDIFSYREKVAQIFGTTRPIADEVDGVLQREKRMNRIWGNSSQKQTKLCQEYWVWLSRARARGGSNVVHIFSQSVWSTFSQNQDQWMTIVLCQIFLHTKIRVERLPENSCSVSLVPQEMSLNIDMNRILPVKFSGVSPNLYKKRLTSSLSCNVLIPGKIFHSNSIDSPSILSKFL